jgi:hypothetical protein
VRFQALKSSCGDIKSRINLEVNTASVWSVLSERSMSDEIKGKYGNGAIDNCSLDLSIDRTMKSYQSDHSLMIESVQRSSLEGVGTGGRGYVDDDDDDNTDCCCLCLSQMYSSQEDKKKKVKFKRFALDYNLSQVNLSLLTDQFKSPAQNFKLSPLY